MLTEKIERLVARTIRVKPRLLQPKTAIVSFTFDDFPRSAFLTGGRILQGVNAVGTYYASGGLANGYSDGVEQFRWEDLDQLVAAGHELACHTHSHTDCQKADVRNIEQDCVENLKAFSSILRKSSLQNFAYPFGRANLAAKKLIGRRFVSGRGIHPGINHGICDLAQLKAYALYQHSLKADRIELLIDKVRSKRGWLIFYTHDVSEKPSPYGCSPELLQQAVRCAVTSGCEILPVRQALKRLAPKEKVYLIDRPFT